MKNLLHIFKIFFIFALPIAAENLYENLNADQLKRLDYLSENIGALNVHMEILIVPTPQYLKI